MKFKNISTSSIHSMKKIVPDYYNNYRGPLGTAGDSEESLGVIRGPLGVHYGPLGGMGGPSGPRTIWANLGYWGLLGASFGPLRAIWRCIGGYWGPLDGIGRY